MIWLVLWSFVLAITPVVLGLTWKLISGMAPCIGLGLSRFFEGGDLWDRTSASLTTRRAHAAHLSTTAAAAGSFASAAYWARRPTDQACQPNHSLDGGSRKTGWST